MVADNTFAQGLLDRRTIYSFGLNPIQSHTASITSVGEEMVTPEMKIGLGSDDSVQELMRLRRHHPTRFSRQISISLHFVHDIVEGFTSQITAQVFFEDYRGSFIVLWCEACGMRSHEDIILVP
jgi:hypothetical protein